MATEATHLHCHLWKNNESDVGVFGTDWSQGSVNAFMRLQAGDSLSIRHDDRNNEEVYGGHWSMFSALHIC